MTSADTFEADQLALRKVLDVVPVWDGLARAGNVLPLGRTLLHAGPPIDVPENACRPILNSAALAAWYEGWCETPDDGEARVMNGEIALAPAQDHGVVVPLAGIVSPSMVLQRVRDEADLTRTAWSPFNGGMGPAMRLGLRDPAVVERWRWLNGDFAEALAPALDRPVDLMSIAAHSLDHGDDCHGRTPVATAQLAEILTERLGAAARRAEVAGFLADSPGFFLNLWMAATKCMLSAGEDVPGSALITAMGGNGVQTGLKVSALPGRWFTAPAAPPEGPLSAPFGADDRLGAIGDSAIVDAFGLGAMAMSFAPEQQKALGDFLPEDVLELPGDLLAVPHPGFGGRNLLVGLSAARVVERDRSSAVSLGILDKHGKGGRIGGGLYRPGVEPFRAAIDALQQD